MHISPLPARPELLAWGLSLERLAKDSCSPGEEVYCSHGFSAARHPWSLLAWSGAQCSLKMKARAHYSWCGCSPMVKRSPLPAVKEGLCSLMGCTDPLQACPLLAQEVGARWPSPDPELAGRCLHGEEAAHVKGRPPGCMVDSETRREGEAEHVTGERCTCWGQISPVLGLGTTGDTNN
ncbi:hypothetical protein Dimus_028226 [Dionaea muscipula]